MLLICHLPILAQDFQVRTLVRSGNLVEVGLDVAQGLQALPVDQFPLDREVEVTADFLKAIVNTTRHICNNLLWVVDPVLVLNIL